MGSFSWCYCDMGKIRQEEGIWGMETKPTRKQRLVAYSHSHPASVLFPEEFGGESARINVESYLDYGMFAGKDIYDLVAEWNRRWLSENPDWVRPSDTEQRPIHERPWYKYYADLTLTREEVIEKWQQENPDRRVEWRYVGIDIACYNEDNAVLKYPIKIARKRSSRYETCPASIRDPYQGF